MRNIRSYESADLTLGPGTTLLSGDVGSGKTSILYAIEMALFGFAEVDPTYLVRHQAGEASVELTLADDAHRYEFGRRFRRRRRRGREVFELESASYSLDGATSSYSVTEIRQRAISLLGFPDNPNPRAHSDLWRWAVYVPQERMREVLAQEVEERLETVRKALGLEQYRTAAENARFLATELRRMAERAESEARGRDHLVEEQPTLALELSERESQVRSGESALEAGLGEVRAAEAHLIELDRRRQGFDRDRGEEEQLVNAMHSDLERATRLEGRGREIETEANRWTARRAESAELGRRVEEARRRLLDLDDRLVRGRAERESASTDLASLAASEARLAAGSVALAHAVAERDRIGEELARADEETARLAAEGPQREPPAPTRRTLPEIDAALEGARSAAESPLAEIARWEHVAREDEELRSAGVCPRCHQKVDPGEFAAHDREVAEALDRARRALDLARRAASDLGEERRARERFERSHQRWTDLESARATARDRYARASALRDAAARRKAETEADSAAASEEVARLRPRAEHARSVSNELARLESERTRQERELSERLSGFEEARQADAALARVERDRAAWMEERAEGERQAEQHRRALARIRERLAEVPRLLEETRRAQERLDGARQVSATSERSLERARTLMESARSRLAAIAGLLQERQAHLDQAAHHREMAAWFGQAFREAVLALEQRLLARAQVEFERDFTRFFTTLVEDPSLIARCDAAFSPAVEIDGEWTPAEALSGGERTALALAFRLALGQVVRAAGRLHLETLILDEPTDGFSPEQVVRMGELLESLGLPQVLLVSHEAQLTAIADRVVRIQKTGGRSELTLPDTEGSTADPGPPSPVPLGPTRRARTRRLDASNGPAA